MQIFTIADKQNRLVSQSKSLSQKGFAILAGHCSKTFEWACKNPVRYPKFGRKSEFIEKHRQYSIMIIFTVTHVTVISAVFFSVRVCSLSIVAFYASCSNMCSVDGFVCWTRCDNFCVWMDKWNITFHYCMVVKIIRIRVFKLFKLCIVFFEL